MPTAAKLVSGIFFALTAYMAAQAFERTLPDHIGTRWFSEVNSVLGFLVGWFTMGPAVGAGWTAAWRKGMGVSVMGLLWSVVLFSFGLMLRQSTKDPFKSLDKGISAVFENLLEFLLAAMTPWVIFILLAGGAVTGIMAEAAHRKWR